MLTFELFGQAFFKIEGPSPMVTDPYNREIVGLNPPPENVGVW